ncbi:MAG: outer membrane beta-barrel protein [Rikenellaceae bacterium]
MRKILLTLALTLAISAATTTRAQSYVISQSANYENFFSTRMGVNFATLDDPQYSSDCQTGFNVAGLYNISLMRNAPLYLQSGVAIEMKGARSGRFLGDEYPKTHYKSYGFEIPIVATYDIKVGQNTAIVTELGFYYSYAFAGSIQTGDYFFRPYEKEEYTVADDESVSSRLFKRNDFGIRCGLSLRLSRCLIGFAYDAGLLDVYPGDIRGGDNNIKTGCFSINLGYRFN